MFFLFPLWASDQLLGIDLKKKILLHLIFTLCFLMSLVVQESDYMGESSLYKVNGRVLYFQHTYDKKFHRLIRYHVKNYAFLF